MARSSRRRGRKMPGVSTKMSCERLSMAIPRMSARVVCTFGVTIDTLVPTSALVSVDLPTLGAPISATKPQRVSAAGPPAIGSATARVPAHALALQHGGGGRLLGRAFCAAGAFGRSILWKLDNDAEFRIVMRPTALELAIGGRRQAAPLRPFLQHGFGIAQRPVGRQHALLPEALDQDRGGGIAAVEKNRADDGLTDVSEDSLAQPCALRM